MSVLIGGSIVSDSSQLVAGRTNKNPRRERGAFWLADLAGWIRPWDPTNHGGPGDYRPAHLGRALLGSRLFSLPRDPGWWGGGGRGGGGRGQRSWHMDVLLLRELLHDTGLPAVRGLHSGLGGWGGGGGGTQPSSWEFCQDICTNVKKSKP